MLCLYDAGTRHGGEVIEDLEGFFAPAQERRTLGRRAALPDKDSPQHPAGRVPELRPVDLPVRPHQPGSGRLRVARRGDPGPRTAAIWAATDSYVAAPAPRELAASESDSASAA